MNRQFEMTLGKVSVIFSKVVVTVLLLIMAAFTITSISPVYNFEDPAPFAGEDIYDPYAGVDYGLGWKRANFHTHTKVKGIFNECKYWPDHVDSVYRSLGYDIVTFSNHNELTDHPSDSSLQVNVYEHGVNVDKFHKLVFGSDRVNRLNHLLSFLPSQRQWELDVLRKDADIIQLNHPARTLLTTRGKMEKLSGYELIELDSGVNVEQEYWDWALSAGHYSCALANDDLHFPDNTSRIAVRCNFLNCASARYEDILGCLRSGAFYSMRIPDYGGGNWDVKRTENRKLPSVKNIGAHEDTVYLKLSSEASLIRVNGQDGAVVAQIQNSDSLSYVFGAADTYARFTAFFPDGAVIYTNPFARYDASQSGSPYRIAAHPVNWTLTVLFNLLLLTLLCGYALAFCYLWGVRIFKR